MTVRLPVLEPLDRRSFCKWSAAFAAGLTLAGCSGDGEAIETGALGEDDPLDLGPDAAGGSTPVDGGTAHPVDGAPAQPGDSGVSTATCPGTPRDVGLPSVFALNTPVAFGTFFVVRDAGGLYAVTSQCTHRIGVTMAVSSGRFRCPRHGAIFTYEGAVVSGPVIFGLVHYATCVLPNGHIGVSTSQVVAGNVRLVA